ncbi:MAG: Crp/Fnr family transcriptional regulator [Alphaproteobacteria bacterium]|nr:Crp/Fnr family transcriptional regulator [Alphaproteobacteria bacterium]
MTSGLPKGEGAARPAGPGIGTGDEGLGAIRLLEGLDAESLAELAGRVRWVIAAPGEVLLTRDSDSRDVFFLVAGRVRIVNYSTSGREVAYANIAKGEYFGEISAIDGRPRSATAEALERSRLAALDPASFRELLLKRPEIALKVMAKLAAIVRTCDDKIMDLATLSAYQRVYTELLRLTQPDPVRAGSWYIYPLPTQAQIASLASTTRETVARVLGQLTQTGIVERKGRTLYVREKAKLELLAERAGTAPPGHA